MKSIDLDLDVSKAIAAHQRDTDETPNTVLRRLLRLEPADAPVGSLADKSGGLMVGVAVGNLLGIPYEGGRWHRAAIAAEFSDGIREIAAKPGWPDDDAKLPQPQIKRERSREVGASCGVGGELGKRQTRRCGKAARMVSCASAIWGAKCPEWAQVVSN